MAEGEIAALDIISKIKLENKKNEKNKENQNFSEQSEKIIKEYENILNFEKNKINEFSIEDLEEGMQKVMDEYAGGISTNYQFNEKQLKLADEKISQLLELSKDVKAEDMHDLMFAYELKDRLLVCKSLIAHLLYRKETRWHTFNENLDHPETDEKFFKYVNSKLINDKLKVFTREIVKEDFYEHSN